MDKCVQKYPLGSFEEAQTLTKYAIFQKINFLLMSFSLTINGRARKVTFLLKCDFFLEIFLLPCPASGPDDHDKI